MLKKVLLGGVIIYALVGFFLLPYIAKPQILQVIKQNLNATATLEKIFFNPFSFSVTLQNFTLYDLNKTKVVSFDKFYINLDPSDFIFQKATIHDLLLDKFYLYVAIDKNNQLNLQKLIKDTSSSKSEKNSAMIQFLLQKALLQNAKVVFDDFSKKHPYHFQFDRIKLQLENITNVANNEGKVRFFTTLGLGGWCNLYANIHSLTPTILDGNIQIKANQLYNQWRYVKENLHIEVADGKLSLASDFVYNQQDNNQTVLKNLNISLNDLRLKPKTNPKDVLRLQKFVLTNGEVYPSLHKVVLDAITLDSLQCIIKRASNKTINWQQLVQTSFASSKNQSPKTKKTAKQTKPWDVIVKKIALDNFNFDFYDAAVTPVVRTTLDKMYLHIKNFQLNSKKPFDLAFGTNINKQGKCTIDGAVVQQPLLATLHSSCNNLYIPHYNPYIIAAAKQNLRRYDIDLQNLFVDFGSNIKLLQKDNAYIIQTSKGTLTLRDLKIAKHSTKERIVKLAKLAVDDVIFNSNTKDVKIAKVFVDKLFFYPKRYRNKHINLASLVIPKHTKQQKNSSKKQTKPIHIHLKEFDFQRGYIYFKDYALKKPTTTSLRGISFKAYDIDSKRYSSFVYRFYTRLNKKGKIAVSGKVRHTPLKVFSRIKLQDISLKDFSPYVEENANLVLRDGFVDLVAKSTYMKRRKAPDLRLNGNFVLKSFGASLPQKKSYLFGLNQLNMKDFQLELSPNRFYANKVLIDSLFVDAFIDKNKIFNFSLIKKESSSSKEQKQIQQKQQSPFNFTIAQIHIKNSNALFADYSLPVKFKTEIHEINGDVYALSNQKGEISYSDIKGVVDKYGSMKLKGSLQGSNPKNYTDIAMHFRNLDLHALSGYSAEFAGYKIKKGKLFVDLAYKIKASKMQGDNAILIKNIELGEEVEDENVTHLPLGLAIALLEDNNGMIEINMPVEGNVDNPDFKYGKVVFKAFVNLITKAVAAPFKFLGAALGINADNLDAINFEPGSAVLLPSELEKLDTLTKILLKRPKIQVVFSPTYIPALDTYALKTQVLIKKLLKESQIQSDKNLQNALTIDLLEELYLQKHSDKELEALHETIQTQYKKDDIVAIEYQKALLHQVIQDQPLQKGKLQFLALQRVHAIIEYLTKEKMVDKKRLKIAKILKEEAKEGQKEIELKVDINTN